ncbi:hypothetical protein B0H65DRAFT_591224 [Neurospora tetraspora]|uniref:DUF7707 domain-containing protein n=1 Tax=Neurospora tetraspora TaxID=94610 RepID=A0AAE0J911_9PEZI|nr:hypothetical protein B0H65DRAFT_591224 [Neurospora tetraspora]
MFQPTLTSLLLPLLALLTAPISAYDFSTTLPTSGIPDAQKNDWCTTHVETCGYICGTGMGTDNLGVKTNSCLYTSLQYECVCIKDNLKVKMELFHYTVPGLMCEAAWKACRKTNEGNEAVKKECDEKIRRKCGHLRTKEQETKNEGIYGFFKSLGGSHKRKVRRRFEA